MMVVPLGPDFAAVLGIPAAHIGWIGGAYSLAACLSGLAGTFYLDRFDRRRAMAWALAGLVAATALGGLAVDLPTLIAARLAAGAFGGPAMALAVAVIADNVAPERRGQAMGMVMGSFSLSAVLGIPIGLELARLGGWSLPFFAVAGLGLAVALAVVLILPPQRRHLGDQTGTWLALFALLLGRRRNWLAYLMILLNMIQIFMIVPNISAFVQFNLGFPRPQLGLLYLIGGTISFFTMRAAGRLVDRFGAAPVSLGATIGLSGAIWGCYVSPVLVLPVMALVPVFMVCNSARLVANTATISKVPGLQERAGFMALATALQNAAASAGAFLSAVILDTAPDGRLIAMPENAMAAIAVGVAVPVLMALLERELRGPPPQDALPCPALTAPDGH
ncbi:MAG: MFS transporter [Azospirillum sp.]|nr:MFS transporter [Azospirillum sp.]